MTIAQEHNYGLSPGSSPENMNSGLFDDLDSKEDLFDDDSLLKPVRKGSNRKGPDAAGKRATHNAIERARRESLNGRFMTLAEALPSMANVKRPSKSVIVNKALDFVYDAQIKEHALIKENNDLRRQVDQLRSRLGMAPLPPPAPLPCTVASPMTASGRAPRTKQHSVSYPSAADNFHEEAAAAMGAMPMSLPAGSSSSVFSNSPPTSISPHESLPSPSGLPSPAASMHSVGSVSSPGMAFPGFNSGIFVPPAALESVPATSPTEHDGLDLAAVANTNNMQAFHLASSPGLSGAPQQHTQQQAHFSAQVQAQAHVQAQAVLLQQQAQLGYLNPSLLTHQHTLMLAAHFQQQQQMQHQQHQHQQQQTSLHDLFGGVAHGTNLPLSAGGAWNGFGGGVSGAPDSFASYAMA